VGRGNASPILKGSNVRFRLVVCFLVVTLCLPVPSEVILVKGAWSSASDAITPLPEGSSVTNTVFSSRYFGITYALPLDWKEKYKGPPPSDSGRYVLAQISNTDTSVGSAPGSILITAQDMFFTPLPAVNALEFIKYEKDHLQSDYKVEVSPTTSMIGGRSWTIFGYWSPVAGLHWYDLATEIRCHTVEIIINSRDKQLMQSVILSMDKMQLPAEANHAAGAGRGNVPVCIKDYSRDENLITRIDPVFTEHRFNPVPVRVIIDKEGKVKHIHFISAFADQAAAISDALKQWRFKPYLIHGKPAEVETSLIFGRRR
jgi:hypothetical protein